MRGLSALKWVLFIALLLSHTIFLTFCAVRKSACFDEGAHLAAGCAYLKWGEFSIYDLSPPPLRCWAALPAYLAGARVPPAKPLRDHSPLARHWLYFDEFQTANLHELARYILWGRLMLMPLSVAVAALIFTISRRMWGYGAGIVSCALWCFSPTVLADASTIGTDIGFVLGALIGVAWWWRFLQSGSKTSALIAAAGMALADVSKFSAVVLWPLLLVLAIVAVWMRKISLKSAVAGFLLVAILNYLAINASYEDRLMGARLDSFDFLSDSMRPVAHFLPGWLPVPFPHDLVEGLDAQKWELDGKYAETLFGQTYFGSDWRYYPILLGTKLTLAELAMLVLAVASLWFVKPALEEIPYALLAGAFFVSIVWGIRYNNGVRYLLPVMFPMAVLMGRVMRAPQLRAICIAVMIYAALDCAVVAPRFHSYCNIVAERSGFQVPDRDWGQSLLDLKRWMARNHQARITVINFSAVSPQVYGIDSADPLGPVQTEFIAIGRRFLTGMSYKSGLNTYFVRPWKRLQHVQPAEDLGGILVYRAEDVQKPGEAHWIVRVDNLNAALKEPELAPIRGIPKNPATDLPN